MKLNLKRLLATVTPFGIVAFALLATAGPALANAAATTGAGAIQFTEATTAINSIIAFATGPVAKVIAVMAVIGGAVAFSQGREMNEGLKNLGIVAIVIGLLIGVTNMVNGLSGALL